MTALFALVPAAEVDAVIATAQASAARAAAVVLRRYPPVDGVAHLFSVVRDGRDRLATRWLRGLVLAVAGGAVLGAVINGVLAHWFGLFSGLPGLAVALGLLVGAFLGALTAAMTGTQVARSELRPLLQCATPGDVLLQWGPADVETLRPVVAACESQGLRWRQLD